MGNFILCRVNPMKKGPTLVFRMTHKSNNLNDQLFEKNISESLKYLICSAIQLSSFYIIKE